jgi:hypothetical protein
LSRAFATASSDAFNRYQANLVVVDLQEADGVFIEHVVRNV